MSKKKVVVAMSGGVDSSVVAAMLKSQGHEVIGITLQLYDYGQATQKAKSCCASKDIADAQEVAKIIDIPHYTFNYEDIFKQEVIDNFVDSYTKGYTPIPCVRCNQTVKFRDLYKFAKDLGADFLATGHYVRKNTTHNGVHLLTGLDQTKDQSYFLFSTTYQQLEFLEFPLGSQTKEETRKLALQFGLPTHNKHDSQDICFVPNGNYRSIVEKFSPHSFQDGNILNISNNQILGQHKGIANFTLGQRRGIGISSEKPLFVVKIDPQTNTVYVGEEHFLYKSTFTITEPNNLLSPAEIKNDLNWHNIGILKARIRSSGEMFECAVKQDQKTVNLTAPTRAITPGQACVLYLNDRVIGGGFIDKILD